MRLGTWVASAALASAILASAVFASAVAGSVAFSGVVVATENGTSPGTCTVSDTVGPESDDGAEAVWCIEWRLRGLGELPTEQVDGRWDTSTTAAVQRVQRYLSARGFPSGAPGAADAAFAEAIGLADIPAAEVPTPCTTVGIVGDSLTLQGLPQLITALRDRGVVSIDVAAHGGRGVFFHDTDDLDNGELAAAWMADRDVECWIVALGTNDVENNASGTLPTTPDETITAMMTAIDPTAVAPVLWVTLLTRTDTGFFANPPMAEFNDRLHDAQRRWPNLHIADWAGRDPGDFKPDGVHLTPIGYAQRAAIIGDELITQLAVSP